MFKNWSVGRPVKFAEGMPAVFWGGLVVIVHSNLWWRTTLVVCYLFAS